MCNVAIDYKQLDDQGRLELDQKLVLEQRFRGELRRVFTRIVQDFRVALAATGQIIDAMQYAPLFESALQVQYRRSQREFRGVVEESQGGKAWLHWHRKQTPEEEEDEEELILLALLAWLNGTSSTKADFISGTNARQMQQAVEAARALLVQEGTEVTNRNLAATAEVILQGLFRVRIERIIVTERDAAESTKLIEAQAMSGEVPFSAVGIPGVIAAVPQRISFKTWRDQRDNRVRDTHTIVNGTRIRLSQPFRVGSSLLLFPGDSSLNAQVKEVANCRCYLTYDIR